ncbi:MAG TPA: hypothetical protein DHV18_10525 [Brochothrix thermosphacta]|nr:hypothetical protein [Brochothrix thermosphacta]
MNKNQFIMTLSKHLKRLPAEERDDILTYYSEFIDEGMTMKTENEVIAEIGSPKRIAREVTADFAIKELNDKDTSVKRRSTTLWWVMAGILSSPVTLPLMVVVVALLMVAAVVSLTLVVCYAVVFIAFTISGLGAAIAGILIIPENVASSFFFVGIGFVAMAIGGLLMLPIKTLCQFLFKVISGTIQKLYRKIQSKRGVNR